MLCHETNLNGHHQTIAFVKHTSENNLRNTKLKLGGGGGGGGGGGVVQLYASPGCLVSSGNWAIICSTLAYIPQSFIAISQYV